MQTQKTTELPDIQSAKPQSLLGRELDWVGMSQIEVPVYFLQEGGQPMILAARAEAGVNLVNSEARGIHMSRIYRTLMQRLPKENLSFGLLKELAFDFLGKQEGLSTSAEIKITFELPLLRSSLKSDLQGFRTYPVSLRVLIAPNSAVSCELQVRVTYSSTCPQSAALARQIVAEDFAQNFSTQSVNSDEVRQWLISPAGMQATPHAQRSVAEVTVQLKQEALNFEPSSLIDLIEEALQTPVQTVVKREDEQEFARRNGTNLMFCEDAARRILLKLKQEPGIASFSGQVQHLESLHPHDAVAKFSAIC